MQGCTDDELAFSFGLDPKIIRSWRKMYPSFDEAIEEGRTVADLQVIEALHKKAVGYSYEKDIVVRNGKEVSIETIEHVVEPETNSIKFWLQNRDSKRWNVAAHVQLSGKRDEPPIGIGVKSETKVDLINSILGLIQPKPDGA